MNIENIADGYFDSILQDVVTNASSWDDANERAHELAWEYADGSEYVIYHYKAHELIATLPRALRDRAEYMQEDIFQGYYDYDDTADQLAFCALYIAIQDCIDERLPTALDELDLDTFCKWAFEESAEQTTSALNQLGRMA
jgi:hypothetical protein